MDDKVRRGKMKKLRKLLREKANEISVYVMHTRGRWRAWRSDRIRAYRLFSNKEEAIMRAILFAEKKKIPRLVIFKLTHNKAVKNIPEIEAQWERTAP